MQNNVTDLSQKLQRSLDNNYNVIDMPAVIEIISTLEKTAVTKELLETTRLGKYINELRRKTKNESLAKRAKELVKKWRDMILPDANNGQIKSVSNSSERSESPDIGQLKGRKRLAKDYLLPDRVAKRPTSVMSNGQSREFDFSDNSNCSVKDLKKTDVIFINSDSNSSIPDQTADSFGSHSNDTFEETTQPKKRGRKKGSKNHKNLIIAAEESFTNKMSAVSRNSKVKTTQELLADIQNRTVSTKQTQDIELRAAQLTESLSRIDQKLNPQKQINKNVTPIRNERTTKSTSSALNSDFSSVVETNKPSEIWSSSRSTPEVVVLVHSDEEIVDVVGTDPPVETPPLATPTSVTTPTLDVLLPAISESLTIEEIRAKLPPINRDSLTEPDSFPLCECPLPPVVEPDNITVQIVDGEDKKESVFCPSPELTFEKDIKPQKEEFRIDKEAKLAEVKLEDTKDGGLGEEPEENLLCPAFLCLRDIYNLDGDIDAKVDRLHSKCLPNVNGNIGLRGVASETTPIIPTTGGTNATETTSSIPTTNSPPTIIELRGVANDSEATPTNSTPTTITEVNIVPNMTKERLSRDLTLSYVRAASENYNKYSISISDECNDELIPKSNVRNCDNVPDDRTDTIAATSDSDTEFREWHETLDVLSYNGEKLRILPYVIID